MLKKTLKLILFSLLLFIFVLFVFRNSIIKYHIESFLSKSLKASCKIEKLNLSFNFFKIQGLKINSRNFEIKAEEIFVKFSPIAFRRKDFIRDVGVSKFSVSFENFQVSNLSLKKAYKNLYSLKIDTVRIKNEQFINFLIPIKAAQERIIFPKAQNSLLGKSGYVTAVIDINKYEDLCFSAKFNGVSFGKIIDAFASEDAGTTGLFDGKIKICLAKFKISGVDVEFVNKGKGIINIKKESSLAFLKTYLDKPSYNALIDNFKNYEYNEGVVIAKNDKGVLGLNLDFTSETMGRRNIAINFHNILGGKK